MIRVGRASLADPDRGVYRGGLRTRGIAGTGQARWSRAGD